MKIRTQFILTTVLFGIILVIIAGSAVIAHQKIKRASEQEKIASSIAQGASELSYLANDYLIYRESQQLNRWRSKFASFSRQVASLNAGKSEQQTLVRNIQANDQRLKEVFESTVSAAGIRFPNQDVVLDPAFLQVSWSRMAVQSQGVVSDASRLSQLLRAEMDQLIETRTRLMFAMVGLFGVFLLIGYLLTYHRILNSISILQAGTSIIGSGNLDFEIEEKKNDEIGDLSRAFNRMATDLKAVTASKADLEREISERKRAEEALRESEGRLRFTLEACHIGAWDLDLLDHTALRSLEHDRIFGYADLLPHWTFEMFLEHVLPEDRPMVDAKFQRVTENQGDWNIECRIRRADGQVRWIWTAGSHRLDANNRVRRIVGIVQDITERKQVEEGLREAHDRALWLAQLSEENPNPVVRVSSDGTVLYRNPASAKLQGWKCEVNQVLGNEISPLIGRAIAEEKEVQEDVLLAGRIYIVWIAPFSEEGYANIYGRDITERKRAEEAVTATQRQIQSIIDNTPAIVYAFDLEERFVMANASIAELLNSTPEQMIGKRRHAFMSKEDADWHEANDRQVIDAGRALEFEEYSQLKSRSITWLTTKFPLRDAEGKIYAVAGISADISERKRTEEALQRTHKELQEYADRLEAANKELESFSYSVSHDLRAPLRAIAGFTQMILAEKGGVFDAETRRKFGVVQQNAGKMGHLIDDLLRLSRVGRAELNRSKLDMADLARGVLQEARSTEPERRITAEVGDLPAAYGDPGMVRQLLANLLANAVKFTRGKQDGRIQVGSFQKSGEQVYYVRDNGVGFDMKYYNKLFGVFQRLVTESQFEGTGVGLAIVQRIVQRHGGRVWAEGEIDEGATFYFTLPPED